MGKAELTLELRPWRDGAYTLISLRGAVATVPQPKEVRQLLSVLSWWSGAPVDVALSVDGTNAGSRWLEVWDDVLKRVPARHLQLGFVLSRDTLTSNGTDER